MSLPWHIMPTPQRRRLAVCYRAPSEPTIDGDLDKPFWKDAPWTELFVDIEGESPAHAKPTWATRAKLLWDDRYLYVGAQLEEPHLWATLTQRDSIVFHDNDFEVFLSPRGSNHHYYEIEINALGTIFDLHLAKPYRDGGPADHDWNVEGLLSAVKLDGTLNDPRDTDRGWSVEMAFPWKAFDRHLPGGAREMKPPVDGDRWRLNFSRVQWDLDVLPPEVGAAGAKPRYAKVAGRPEHNWVWSPQGIIDMHRPEMWGELQFSGVVAGKGVAKAIPDPTAALSRALHCVYYAQVAYRREHGRWASEIDQLTLSEELAMPVEMRATPTGWTAMVSSDHGPLAICDDSLVFRP